MISRDLTSKVEDGALMLAGQFTDRVLEGDRGCGQLGPLGSGNLQVPLR